MDKNTIIGIILILLIFAGFSVFNNTRLNKKYQEAVKAADIEMAKGNLEGARIQYINALNFKPNQVDIREKLNEVDKKLGISEMPSNRDTTAAAQKTTEENLKKNEPAPFDPSQLGPFANAAKGDSKFITLENNKLELKISLKGGKIYSAKLKEYETYDSLPVVLCSGDSTSFGFNFFTADNKAIQTNELYFMPVSDSTVYTVNGKPESVRLRLKVAEDKYIEYKYTLAPDKYSLGYEVIFRNLDDIIPKNMNSITLGWKMYLPQQEQGRINEDNYTTIKYKYYQDDVEWLQARTRKAQDTKDLTTKLSWIAFQDQFFSSILITDNYFLNGSISSTKTPESKKYLRYFTTEVGVPYVSGPESKVALRLYYGPNHITTLRKEGLQLDRVIFLGKNIIGWISRFIILPVFNWLNNYIGNYGIIILILTILLKIVLFPLTFKSYESTAKMQVLKPLVDEIGKKFPKQEDSMKKQQATMDLYKRAGINPMGGCLPTLLQFPILFAMFRLFPVSIELRHQPFLWAHDLSTFDSILKLPFTIPAYGNHVSLFTLLMTASSFLTMQQSGATSAQQQPGMKMMTWMMPIMFMFMFNNFSSGLTYYYFLANVISWIQNLISKRFINAEKVLATLEANKKKPIPKSKWQQRLESAARQRGINAPKK